MSGEPASVSRDELVALFAGDLDAAAEATVLDRLARDPRGAEKLDRLRSVDVRVRAAVDADRARPEDRCGRPDTVAPHDDQD